MSKRSHSSMSNGGGSILSSMLSSLSKTNESTLSAKQAEAQVAKLTAGRGQAITVDANSVAPDAAIAQFLQDMRATIDEKGLGAEIEVELRFGKITSCLQDARCRPSQEGVDAAIVLADDQMKGVGAKFVPGVVEAEFPTFVKGLEYLLKGDGFSEHLEKQVVHNMPQSKRIIEQVDLSTSMRRAPQVQAKERLGSIDIFLPHCKWDCRVSISCEFPLRDLQGSLSEMPAAESIRHKDRTSAVGKDLRVDLTKVLEENTNKKSYEVEVELNQTVVSDWLRQPDENGQSWKSATVTASYLWKMVKYFMPQAGQAFKSNWGFPSATEVQNAYQLRLGVRNKFSGTMPVGFARWHIPLVKTREYFVSEKTDGVRYFLVVAGDAVVLVDRSNAPFVASGLDLLKLVLPEGTVLDGELVFHQRENRYVFMVFDIIATGPSQSDSHVDKPFTERLRILNDFLSDEGPYAAGIRDLDINRHAILPILRKKWVPVRHISDVFRQIQRVQKRDQSLGRIYSDDKRTHYTDGIVFCPNTPYVPNTHKEYLKWKWSDLITVDFLAQLTDSNTVALSCGGPRNTHVELDSIVVLDPRDVPTVQKILARTPSRSAILEFGFNADKGFWNYKCARPDKDVANYIRTVLGSLVNMAEAISEEELQYRLTNPNSEQWNNHMKKMRRSLLDQK
uniref:mRNA 5'-phosphatase n=1 Tax=Globisporangium ultimum (strain ATCC 200006 / CBS 805.95 / DAOM BR144) TaxID=431595 RepID=K3W9X5_GLOUD